MPCNLKKRQSDSALIDNYITESMLFPNKFSCLPAESAHLTLSIAGGSCGFGDGVSN
jgi:hypothetical protein